MVQKAKEAGTPALYFTNLVSARPLFGVAGAGSLAQVVNAAIAGKTRLDEMKTFFEGVGEGHSAGVWEDTPKDRPEYREAYRRKLEKAAASKKVEEPV